MSDVLNADQISILKNNLEGKLIALSFGAGVDSTAMIVALKEAGIKPAVITFADTGGEKRATYEHLALMQSLLKEWGWPEVYVCKKLMQEKTGYTDLYGNCIANETLPSLAFGMHSCSIKYKVQPQDQYIKGAKRGPNAQPAHPIWMEARERDEKIVKLIGYDNGAADIKRSSRLKLQDSEFDYCYPLQLLNWRRQDCVIAITKALGAQYVPMKSACFFCPASKIWELYWLAAHEPELLEQALHLERNAMTGRHSRFDTLDYSGANWLELVKAGDRFPSTSTTVGLGRSFSWNHWAVTNQVVDANFKVYLDRASVQRFTAMSESMRSDDNALDIRSAMPGKKVIQIELAF